MDSLAWQREGLMKVQPHLGGVAHRERLSGGRPTGRWGASAERRQAATRISERRLPGASTRFAK